MKISELVTKKCKIFFLFSAFSLSFPQTAICAWYNNIFPDFKITINCEVSRIKTEKKDSFQNDEKNKKQMDEINAKHDSELTEMIEKHKKAKKELQSKIKILEQDIASKTNEIARLKEFKAKLDTGFFLRLSQEHDKKIFLNAQNFMTGVANDKDMEAIQGMTIFKLSNGEIESEGKIIYSPETNIRERDLIDRFLNSFKCYNPSNNTKEIPEMIRIDCKFNSTAFLFFGGQRIPRDSRLNLSGVSNAKSGLCLPPQTTLLIILPDKNIPLEKRFLQILKN